jgi:hypothetical protein
LEGKAACKTPLFIFLLKVQQKKHIIKSAHLFQDLLEDGKDSAYAAAYAPAYQTVSYTE